MIREDIREIMNNELEKRKKKVRNKKAIDALLSLSPRPVQALCKMAFGRDDAMEDEKQKILIEKILEILLEIDDAIAKDGGNVEKIDWTVVEAKIEAHGENSDKVTGMDISSDAGPVELKAGTHIKVSGRNVRNITGLHIGGNQTGENE